MSTATAWTGSTRGGGSEGPTSLRRRGAVVAATVALVVGILTVVPLGSTPAAVGQASGEWTAVSIPLPADVSGTTARGVNGAGQVVGYFFTDDTTSHAFRWNVRDGALDLLVDGTIAVAVDGSGRVFGSALVAGQQVLSRWDTPEVRVDLPVPAGFEGLAPVAASPAGYAVSRIREDGKVLVWTPSLDVHVVDVPFGDIVSIDDEGRVTMITGFGAGLVVSRVSLDGTVEESPAEDLGSPFFRRARSPSGTWWLYQWTAEGEGIRYFVGESFATRHELLCPNGIMPGSTQPSGGDAWGVNDDGVAVGRCNVDFDRSQATVWLPPGHPLPQTPTTTTTSPSSSTTASPGTAPPTGAARSATPSAPARPVSATPAYTG